MTYSFVPNKGCTMCGLLGKLNSDGKCAPCQGKADEAYEEFLERNLTARFERR